MLVLPDSNVEDSCEGLIDAGASVGVEIAAPGIPIGLDGTVRTGVEERTGAEGDGASMSIGELQIILGWSSGGEWYVADVKLNELCAAVGVMLTEVC